MLEHPIHKGYYITKDGKVVGRTGKILKSHSCPKGYSKVKVDKVSRLVHRLVAETFIPNHNQFPHVNHIDGNKSNNHISNLEWCDSVYNNQHAKYKSGLVYQIFINGILHTETNNLAQFSRDYKLSKSCMYEIIGTNKEYKGFSVSRIIL